MQHDDRFGPQTHPVHDLRLHLELDRRQPTDLGIVGVEDRVLAGVAREPDAELAHASADLGKSLRAPGGLVPELRQVGMAGIGRQVRRHPVEADVVRVEVGEDRVEAVERDAEVRARLPATRVVRRAAAAAEHLDGETQAHLGLARDFAAPGAALAPA